MRREEKSVNSTLRQLGKKGLRVREKKEREEGRASTLKRKGKKKWTLP